MAVDPADYISGDELAKRDQNNVPSIMAQNDSLGTIENVKVEDGYLIILARVWDPNTSTWVRMQQPVTAAGVEDVRDSVNSVYYAETRLAYDANNSVEYYGVNTTLDASTSGTNWMITKYTRTSGNVTRIQVSEGAWDNRALLF